MNTKTISSKKDSDKDNYYWTAVNRNLGLLTEEEQEKLRNSHVVIAGAGAVGSYYLINLVRMGVGSFSIADLDEYSVANINRQYGATSSNDGRPKVEVMAEIAKDIHPGVKIKTFDKGVQPDNVREFIDGADLVIDGMDYFALSARRLLHTVAREEGKTTLLSMPLGFSGTLHAFSPESMSYDDYFDINDNMSPFEQLVAFTIGLSPRGTHWNYMDMDKIDFAERTGPSLACGVSMSVGLVTAEALAIVLNRRNAQVAPVFVQFDPYRGVYCKGKLRWGNRGPLQRLKRAFLRRKFRSQEEHINKELG